MLSFESTRLLYARLTQAGFAFSCIMAFGLPWSSAFFRIGIWGFLICFALSGHWQDKWSVISKISIVWLASALFFLALVSMSYTIAPLDLAQEDVMRYVKLLAIGPLMFTCDTPRKRRLILLAFCVGIAVLMLPTLLDGSSIARFLGVHLERFTNQSYTRETAGKGAPNLVYWRNQIVHGLFVAILCFVCLEKAVRHTRYRMVLLLIAGLCVVDIVYFIQGRMAMLGLVAALILFALLQMKTNRGKMVIVAVAACVAMAAYVAVPNVSKRFNSASHEVEAYLNSGNISTSSGIRFHYWTISTTLFRQAKWLGAGAGAFRHTLVVTQDVFMDQRHSHTHNEYLTVLSQYGAAGFLLFSGLLVTGFILASRLEDTEERHCYIAALLVFALGCLSDSMLYNPHEGWTLVVFLALISAATNARRPINANPASTSPAALSPFAAGKV